MNLFPRNMLAKEQIPGLLNKGIILLYFSAELKHRLKGGSQPDSLKTAHVNIGKTSPV